MLLNLAFAGVAWEVVDHGRICMGLSCNFPRENRNTSGVENLVGSHPPENRPVGKVQSSVFALSSPCYPRRYAKICIYQFRISPYFEIDSRSLFGGGGNGHFESRVPPLVSDAFENWAVVVVDQIAASLERVRFGWVH